ncbi:MAG TPA: CaiB/BaiF CoA-transferase family protein [Lentibacillus sp.]|uniref:CaiB/BaiF CoA transferase family protein n=1 Tax=Lentibacillus sp. TaxID=1925746 RepID=UPI002B4AB6E6|nr:CaiB/BaiF CoA-transferase family protein [Lentibacillus sp.]HLR63010.1 CaiB/BaiF CoA-transferase family protein [Lentibacillus sp.]
MPLKSVRVLDLSRLLPGPYCTMLLADFGAEVIKVEEPSKGDYARAYEPKLDDDSAMFHSLNRNKKSVCLDLKSPEGKHEFLKMAEEADVVVESFRPGVMERLGLGYETLKSVNPRLIYCAVTGYGQTGPYADKPGHDINYLSFAGLLNLMGEKDGKPVVPAAQIADIGGGALPAAVGILLALLEREKSGKGQFVDVSMMDGVISWLQTLLPDYLSANTVPKRGEEMLNGGRACYAVYETKDERFIAVGALEPKFWKNFCEVIGRRDFIPLLEAPLHEQYRLKYEIQVIMSEKTLAEWLELFSDVEACVSPVLTFEEMIEHPQVAAREMIRTVNHAVLGSVKQIGIPIKLSETPGEIYSQAPKLGEHTHELKAGNRT